MAVAESAAQAVALVFAGLFALAVGHKLRVLRRGASGDEPLLSLGGWPERHPGESLAAVALLEVVTLVTLVVSPRFGFLLGALLTAGYAARLRRLPPGEPCNCFGAALQASTSRTAIRRNLGLSVVGGAMSAGYWVGALDGPHLDEASVGYALVVFGAVAGRELLRRNITLPEQATTQQSRRGALDAQ